jgi:hypothetical protein
VISVPVIVLFFIPIGIYIYVPYFLRCLVVVGRFEEFIILRNSWVSLLPSSFSDYSYDYAKERLYVIIARMFALIYFSLCAFHYAEFNVERNTGTTLTLMESFYFTIITMSTVGYGDITPKTFFGRWIVVCTIVIALGILPGLIGAVVEIVSDQNEGKSTVVIATGKPFIVVCGKFISSYEMVDVLNEFYWRKSGPSFRIVFLSSVSANDSIKSVINQNILRDAITFVHGSALNASDLSRIKLEHATAAFIIPDRLNPNRQGEADKIVLRTLAFDNFAPETPLYVYNVLPETSSLQEKISEASICLESLKQILAAYSCIYRGSGTLLVNLIRNTIQRES